MDEDLLNPEVIQEILTEVEKSGEKNRRIQSFNAYQVYSGNQRTYVSKQLQRTRPNSYESYTISNISVSKIITDKRSQAYNERPIRSVDGNESKTELLNQIYTEADADMEMQFFDTVSNLNRYALMWVNYSQKEKRYQFITLQPYEFVLVRDKDTGKLLIVGLNYPDNEITQEARGTTENESGLRTSNGDGEADLIAEAQPDGSAESKTWVFWSATQHVKIERRTKRVAVNGEIVLKDSIDYVEIPGNPNNVNPLGVLPFVYDSYDSSVDYPTVNPLTEQSITFNSQQSETLSSKNLHGSGVAVFKYPERMAGKFQKMTYGLASAIHLPQSSKEGDAPSEYEHKASGSQLEGMMQSDRDYLGQIMKEHGIENFEMDQGVNAMNGISRAIAGSSVQKIIEKNQQRYSKLEKKMFEVIKAWDRLLGSRQFSEQDELQIVFPKPKVMLSDEQTLKNIEKMLELGLIEEWEKFQKMDPNLSEQEAKDKHERVEAEKLKRAQTFLGGFSGGENGRVDQEGETRPNGFEQ